MPLPSEGELSIKDLQEEATIPMGNTNDFVEMAEVYDIADFNVDSPQNITLADDFYGEEVNLTAQSIGVNPTLLTFPSSGGSLTTNLTINGYALMIGKPGWLSTEKTYLGINDAGTLRFTATENNILGSAARNKSIQFIGLNSTVFATLIVSQSGNPIEISLTPSNGQTLAATAGTFTQDVTVTNPLEVTGTVTGSGMTLSAPVVTDLGSTSRYRFTLTRTANDSSGVRTAELNFDISGSNFLQQRSITHTQSGFVASISVTPSSFAFDINGETKLFTITSNTDWEAFTSGDSGFETSVTSASSGFSTTTKTGTGNGTSQNYSIWVRASDNSAGGTNNRAATLVVRENPWAGGGAFDNSNLSQIGNPLPSFGYSDAQVGGFAVNSSGTVTAPTSANNTPISVTYSTGYSNGSFPVVSSNTTRYAYVSATVPSSGYSNSGGVVSGTESAVQTAPVEFISISANKSSPLTGNQSVSIQISVDIEEFYGTSWVAEISYASPSNSTNWVQIAAGGQGTTDGTFFVQVEANYPGSIGYNGSTRYFDLRCYKVGQGLYSNTLSFSQNTGTAPVQKPTISVSPTSPSWTYSQSGAGSAKTIGVTLTGGGNPTNVQFYLSGTYFGMSAGQNTTTQVTGGPWFINGTLSGNYYWSVDVYPLNARSSTDTADVTESLYITVSNSGGSATPTSITLTHEGNQQWSITPTSVTANYQSGNSLVSLSTNLAWRATLTNSTYSSFVLSGGSPQTGTGNKTFTISRSQNNRTGNVTGELLLESTTAGTSKSTTISLTQTPVPSELQAGLNSSAIMGTSISDITPNTNGQTYSLYLKHTSGTGTVSVQISETSSHVGIGTSSGATSNFISVSVGTSPVQLYLSYTTNASSDCRAATIVISSSIASNTITFNSEYGNCSGEACLNSGTKVKLSNGNLVNVENVSIGDVLSSKLVSGMPIKDESEIYDWISQELDILDDMVSVTGVHQYQLETILDFNNGLIKTSHDHLHLVKKQNLYQVVRAENLLVGDFLINENGIEVEIFSIKTRVGNYTVYKLDVEENDLFIANGLLTHNRKIEV